jgi:hypothetical protein
VKSASEEARQASEESRAISIETFILLSCRDIKSIHFTRKSIITIIAMIMIMIKSRL